MCAPAGLHSAHQGAAPTATPHPQASLGITSITSRVRPSPHFPVPPPPRHLSANLPLTPPMPTPNLPGAQPHVTCHLGKPSLTPLLVLASPSPPTPHPRHLPGPAPPSLPWPRPSPPRAHQELGSSRSAHSAGMGGASPCPERSPSRLGGETDGDAGDPLQRPPQMLCRAHSLTKVDPLVAARTHVGLPRERGDAASCGEEESGQGPAWPPGRPSARTWSPAHLCWAPWGGRSPCAPQPGPRGPRWGR